MTTATSTAKKSFFSTRVKSDLKASKNMIIVISVLQLIGLPFISLMAYLDLHTEQNDELYYSNDFMGSYGIPIGLTAFLIAIFLGYVVVMSNFKYLHKGSQSDMNLSLPLTSKQRFIADYVSGLIVYIVPAVIAALLALIPLGIAAGDNSGFNELLKMSPKLFGILIVSMLMFYTFITFAAVCCGTTRSATISALLLNIAIPAVLFVIGAICSVPNEAYFSSDSGINVMLQYICSTSPLGCGIFLMMPLSDEMRLNNPMFFGWLFDVLIVTAIVFVAAYFLYKKRKAEHVSKPYAFAAFHHILMGAGLFSLILFIVFIASLQSFYPDYYFDNEEYISKIDIVGGFIPAVIIGAIFYILVELYVQKSFRNFLRILIRWGGITIFSLVFCWFASENSGFGLCEYVPNENQVYEVSISCYDNGYNIETSFKDKEIIKAVINANKDIIDMSKGKYDDNYHSISIDEYKENKKNGALVERSFESNCYCNVVYYKKTGGFLQRDFYNTDALQTTVLPLIVTSDEYADSVHNMFSDYYFCYDEENHTEIRISKTSYVTVENLSKQQQKELSDAYETDMRNFTYEQFFSSPEICTINDLSIRECFTNTIEFLEKNTSITSYDAWRKPAWDYADKSSLELMSLYTDIMFVPKAEAVKINLSGEGSMRAVTIRNKYIAIGDNSGISSNQPIYDLTVYQDELEEVFNAATKYYCGDEIGGAIILDNSVYYIPAEYADTVKKIYNDMREYIYNNLCVDRFNNAFVYSRRNPDQKVELSIYENCFGFERDYDGNIFRYDENNEKVYYYTNYFEDSGYSEDDYNTDYINEKGYSEVDYDYSY